MRHSQFDGAGYRLSDNRCSGGLVEEGDILSCKHCFALIPKKDVTQPKNMLSVRAFCHACDGSLCTRCGMDTQLYGHENPDHWRTWPHLMWIERAIAETYRRAQNARILGI